MPENTQSDTQLAISRGAALTELRTRAHRMLQRVAEHNGTVRQIRTDGDLLLTEVERELRGIVNGAEPAAPAEPAPVVLTDIERALLLVLNGWPGRHPAASIADRKALLHWSFDQVMRGLNTLALRKLVDKDTRSGRYSISDDGQAAARRIQTAARSATR